MNPWLEKIVTHFLFTSCVIVLLARVFLPNFLAQDYPITHLDLVNLFTAGLIFLTASVWLVRKGITRQPVFNTGFESALGLLAAGAAISLLGSYYVSGSLNATLVFWAYILYFYILCDLFKDPSLRLKFFAYVIVCTIALIFFGLWEYFLPMSSYLHGTRSAKIVAMPYKRIGSLFGLPNVLAGFYLLILPLLFAWCVLASKHWRSIAIGISALVMLSLFLTLSFLCTLNFFLVGLGIAPLVTLVWFHRQLPKGFYIGSIVIILTCLGLVVLSRQDFSFEARLDYYAAAFKGIQTHPWVGAGLDSFKFLSAQFSKGESYSGYTHNSFLQMWAECGILGFIGIIVLVTLFARKAMAALKSTNNPQQKVLLTALIWSLSLFFVDNLTNFTFLCSDVSIFGWVLLAGFVAQTKDVLPVKSSKANAWSWVLVNALVLVCIAQALRMSFGLLAYEKALQQMDRDQYPEAFLSLETAKKYDPRNQFYPAGQGLIHIRVFMRTRDAKFLEMAESKFLDALKLAPSLYVNHVVLARIAMEQKDQEKARRYAAEVRRLCPSRYGYLMQELFPSKNKS